MSDMPVFVDPARPKNRFRPLKAMGHMRRLIANKEDTAQVFHIIDALNGNVLRRNFETFLNSSDGRARFSQRRFLAPLLDDHAGLGDLPAGSVGRTYIDFMKREGLTAAGLVEESQIRRAGKETFNDDLEWYGNRQRDTHDMFHVLTGYGRDALGEAALLAFTHGQISGRGIIFISRVAFFEMRRQVGNHIDFKAVFAEARAAGRAAGRIVEQDIIAMLYEPLDEARARLNIPKPVAYRAALKQLSELPDELCEIITA